MARYKRGETPKLNRELIDEIAAAIRSGDAVERAATKSGISKDTLYRWLQAKQGRYKTPLVLEFQRIVSGAMTEADLRNLGLLGPSSEQVY